MANDTQLMRLKDGSVRALKVRNLDAQPNFIELQRGSQGPSVHRKNPSQPAGSCGCESGGAGDQPVTRRELMAVLGNVNGGVIHPGNRDRYETPYRQGGSAGKGGTVISEAAEIAAGAAAGSEVVAVFSGDDLARLTGERLCYITGLFDSELLAESDKLLFDLLINGDSWNGQFNRISGDYLAKTADGYVQKYKLVDNEGNAPVVPYDSVLSFRVKVVSDLSTATQQTVRLRSVPGEECR